MVKQASLVGDLASITGRKHAQESTLAFSVDGNAPRAVVYPGSYSEVGEVLRYATANRLAVTPWGAGTMMHLGNAPARYDIALSLSRLDAVVEHEAADLTTAFQGGLPLTALQKRLATTGQMVPFGPFPGSAATIGGILATAAYASARHTFGTPRDSVIGLRVVTPDGKLTRAGGNVVKNVAGYDLCKLYIGSLGTLGVIVEVTAKLAPLPEAQRRVALSCVDAAAACDFARELARRGLSLESVELLNPAAAKEMLRLSSGSRYTLALGLAGTHAAVERSAADVLSLARLTGATQLKASDSKRVTPVFTSLGSSAGELLSCRAAVLPTQLPSLIEALSTDDSSPAMVALPTIGILRVSWPAGSDAPVALRAFHLATTQLSANATIEHCPSDLRAKFDVFGPLPRSFDLMRRIKQQFDPNGVLSPGRFVGRL